MDFVAIGKTSRIADIVGRGFGGVCNAGGKGLPFPCWLRSSSESISPRIVGRTSLWPRDVLADELFWIVESN